MITFAPKAIQQKQIIQQLFLVFLCTSSLLVLVYEYEKPSVDQVFSRELINSWNRFRAQTKSLKPMQGWKVNENLSFKASGVEKQCLTSPHTKTCNILSAPCRIPIWRFFPDAGERVVSKKLRQLTLEGQVAC